MEKSRNAYRVWRKNFLSVDGRIILKWTFEK